MKKLFLAVIISFFFAQVTQGYAPDSISGKDIVYTEGSESETATFSSDGKVYGDNDSEWTYYTYEKLSANIGKVIYTFENEQNPMPEEEILTFTSENAGTFEWSEYSDANMSTIIDTGSGTFSVSDNLADPESVIVVSDPSGNPVVVQVGDEYNWNETLEGVMLWGVWQDDDTNEWVIATVNYIGGRQKGAKGSYSSLPAELDVDHPYTINGDTIDVTETNGHQYYQIISVDNDTIYAVDGDGIPLTDPSWWFVTKSAAETFYNSKINYAPISLLGQKLRINEVGYTTYDYFFTSENAYFWDTTLATPKLRGIPYTYEKNSSAEASLFLNQDFGIVTHQITFASLLEANSTWEDNTSSGIGSIQVFPDEYAPDSLLGWKLEAGTNASYKFTTPTDAIFYYMDDTNDSNSELSHITYTWEMIGPSIGKLITSLDEVTWLFFDSSTSGYFDWEEMDADDGDSGEFYLHYYGDGHAHESLAGDTLMLGDTTYVFSSNTSVTIYTAEGKATSEYAYLRNGSDQGVLAIGSSMMNLDFYSNGYGRVASGGSGYFQVISNWATKGWVWHDHYPWAYSNNMQDWYYQVLFINDNNESAMAHYQAWDNTWNIPEELTYSGESNFSSADAYYWEDYDDFNGTELNSSKWDVGYWSGGQSVTISNGQAQLSGTIYSAGSPTQVPSDIAAAASDSTEGNTFLFFKDEEIYGIQADISIPNQTNDYDTGIYLASLDINPLGSLGAELRNKTSGPVLLFDYLDSGNEWEHQETGSLDTFYQLQITKIDGKTSYYLNGNLVKQFDSSSHDEDYWTIGAFNDNGLSYSTFADNVRVLRKRSYPQGWMWMDYYPWAYSHNSDSWLYFQLAKDTDGQPGMIYWDTATQVWDIYYPALSPEQVEDREDATELLNQE